MTTDTELVVPADTGALSTEFLTPQKRAFLAALAHTGNITQAAELAQVDRKTHYNWLAADETGVYAALVADAHEQAADYLEGEARRRAIEGVDRGVYYKGERVDTERHYSDTLLIFLLKGALPTKYKDNLPTGESTNVNNITNVTQVNINVKYDYDDPRR